MANQQNPFALLLDDDEGDDFSILLSNLEPKIPVLPPSSSDRINPKIETNEFPSKLNSSSPNELVRGRGRGYGGRGGTGRGRGRSFAGFGEVGGEFREKSDFGDVRQTRNDARRFGEENQRPNGEERESFGFRGYEQSRRMREFRDGEGHGKSYGGDGESRGFRGGDGESRGLRGGDGESRGFRGGDGESRGFRGGEGRGRGYGGRGWKGGRDGGRGGGRNESNEGFNADDSKKVFGDEKELIVNDISNGDGVSGRDDPSATEEPKDEQSEKPTPENIASEDNTSKVPAEDNEMTLAEYEKLLQEKRKALESLKTETRKVVIDKDFEGMQIIEKKKEDDLTKVKLDNDKGKKKEITEKEEKSRKSQSINEFLKPADGERYRGAAASSRGRGGGGGRGRGRGGYVSGDYPNQQRAAAATPSLEDPSHFPILGAVAKA